jgi:hypothetical protein
LFGEALRFFEPGDSELQNMVLAGILEAVGEATEWNDFNAKFTNGRALFSILNRVKVLRACLGRFLLRDCNVFRVE